MAEAKKRLLTYAGLKALEDELENLKVVKRKEVAEKIKDCLLYTSRCLRLRKERPILCLLLRLEG